jgi:hypothetical protein
MSLTCLIASLQDQAVPVVLQKVSQGHVVFFSLRAPWAEGGQAHKGCGLNKPCAIKLQLCLTVTDHLVTETNCTLSKGFNQALLLPQVDTGSLPHNSTSGRISCLV